MLDSLLALHSCPIIPSVWNAGMLAFETLSVLGREGQVAVEGRPDIWHGGGGGEAGREGHWGCKSVASLWSGLRALLPPRPEMPQLVQPPRPGV